MRIIATYFNGVSLIAPDTYMDARGAFFETYNEREFFSLGIRSRFVQDNHSRSRRGTIRGLHYQLTHPQAKLCRVVAGEVQDVVVDVRLGSPSFGRSVSIALSADDPNLLFVPSGFAHGYCAVSEVAEFLYKVDDFYDSDDEFGVIWNDPDLHIEWRVADPVLSDRDRALPRLCEISLAKLPRWPG